MLATVTSVSPFRQPVFISASPNNMKEELGFLLRIQEVPGSNFDLKTDYPRSFVILFGTTRQNPGQRPKSCQDRFLAHTFVLSYDITQYELRKETLHKKRTNHSRHYIRCDKKASPQKLCIMIPLARSLINTDFAVW